MVVAAVAPAMAQDAPSGVPPAVMQGAIGGTPAGMAALRAYLMSEGSEGVAHLSQNLFQALKDQKDSLDPQTLTRAVSRIANVGTSLIAVGRVMRAGVDGAYVPPPGTVALDFGSPDAPVAKGFERVVTSDPRIAGTGLRPVRRPGDHDLINDGIRGIQKITLKVPDGIYRIVLITQNLGERKLMETPFGREVRVNDSAIAVADDLPQSWIDEAVLTNRGTDLVTRDTGVRNLVQRQDAGFLVIEAAAVNGELVIELRGASEYGTYLNGLVVEPQTRPSSLVLSETAAQVVAGYQQRTATEVAILERAGETLSEIGPAAGTEEPLPEPAFDTAEVASPS